MQTGTVQMTKGCETNPNKFTVSCGDGMAGEPTEIIVPILRQESDARWHLIGTGFFINIRGLIASAKHVLSDVIDEDGNAFAGISILQFLPDNAYIMRPLIRGSVHNVADVGVAIAAPVTPSLPKGSQRSSPRSPISSSAP